MQSEMARVIDRWTEGLADTPTAVPGLTLFRREAPARPAVCMVEPSVIMVTQGTKRLIAGGEGHVYNAERFLITSLDLPANSEVVQASPHAPCLGFSLKLDIRMLAELIAQGELAPPRPPTQDASVGVGSITAAALDPFVRLLGLLDEPGAVGVLAPLIQREIHYRLLVSGQAPLLWQIASVGSQSQRISRAIDWLKLHYTEPLRVDELAARVQMSPSSLHHHFRRLTAMSPLQYQKWLRLNEARRLMLGEGADAASAAYRVGYESPSQFSREYSRLFGAPPRRDVQALRPRPDACDQADRPDSASSSRPRSASTTVRSARVG
ncbi:AraC family transcriptional regulator [Rubrivivax gelatinosus]|uniref:AraC-like DNA-binding protein n=2 Tax=Rubrivivax gelatinosus TaxID=28068 RepID=A0A4R2MBE4_RUBGE|nr:AraC family transcriptional regulator [Rubrivivax gelatinosus]MBG6078491.1 AraC-like DNA-binding protein [Rubrivivax gelatinosus]MBK1685934.1 AraC family transcriptional regulator [Rubrivivax gelatinosus]TCP04042.1 AraC-like DNA-binding protein [Rubrivivax gelatinosus]